ncbi:hypothetical protein D3C79_637670 [compost metagenome]
MVIAEQDSPRPGCINMEIQTLFSGHNRHLCKRIDNPGVGRTGSAHQHERGKPTLTVIGKGGAQLSDIHFAVDVHPDQPYSVMPKPRLQGDLQPGKVAVGRNIEHRLRRLRLQALLGETRNLTRQGTNQCRAIGLRTTGGERPADVGGGKPGQLPQVTNKFLFNVHAGWSMAPDGQLRVVECGNEIGDTTPEGRGRVEQTEIVGAGHMHHALLHQVDHIAKDRSRRQATIKVVAGDDSGNVGLGHRGIDLDRRDVGDVVLHHILQKAENLRTLALLRKEGRDDFSTDIRVQSCCAHVLKSLNHVRWNSRKAQQRWPATTQRSPRRETPPRKTTGHH